MGNEKELRRDLLIAHATVERQAAEISALKQEVFLLTEELRQVDPQSYEDYHSEA